MDSMQPGQMIVPHGPDDQKPTEPTATPAQTQVQQPVTPVQSPASAPVQPEVVAHQVGAAAIAAEDAPSPSWQYQQEGLSAPKSPIQDELRWTASEFIAHEKGTGWYAALIAGSLALTAIVFLLTKDKISTGIVLLVTVLFGVFAGRKPNTLQYDLTEQGLQIGSKFYSFGDFKAFSISEEGAIASVVLLPLKRFMPPLTIYIAPDLADNIVDFIGDFLPFEQHKADAIDGLLKRIRF